MWGKVFVAEGSERKIKKKEKKKDNCWKSTVTAYPFCFLRESDF